MEETIVVNRRARYCYAGKRTGGKRGKNRQTPDREFGDRSLDCAEKSPCDEWSVSRSKMIMYAGISICSPVTP
jgi:hypothetical protein